MEQIRTVISNAITWHKKLKTELNLNNSSKCIEEQFSTTFNDFVLIFENLDKLTKDLSKEKQLELKDYVQKSELVKLTSEGPLFKQIIEKPNGYAGDAQVMRYMYQNRFEGNSNYEKVMHKIASSVITAETVRKRKSLIKEIFKNNLKTNSRVLSLAAGPAFEIKEFLANNELKIKFDAIDHDIDTLKDSLINYNDDRLNYKLANAFKILKGDKTAIVPRNKFLKYTNKKDKNSVLKKVLFYSRTQLKKDYDLVYSLGLYDYISTFSNIKRGSIALTTALFELVKPGGLLVIGNFSSNGPSWIRWHMKFVCDWELIYRNDQEIKKFISGINPNQIMSVDICEEKTGINKFLVVHKKQ